MVHGVKMEQFDKYSDEVWDGLEKLCKTKGIKYAYLFEPSRRDGGATLIIIIIIEGLSLLQSIPPTTADKQTQAQKRRVTDRD